MGLVFEPGIAGFGGSYMPNNIFTLYGAYAKQWIDDGSGNANSSSVVVRKAKSLEETESDKLEQLVRISIRTLKSAKIVVSTIPLRMIYSFIQKYFVSGIVAESVKE